MVFAGLTIATLVLGAPKTLACAACYGQSDSPMAAGMNWGIFSLLAIVVVVLAGVASFFVYLGVKSPGTKSPVETVGAPRESAAMIGAESRTTESCAP